MEKDPDPELVAKAAKMADAHQMILNFDDGYETDIGPGGSNLSGGQKQRIALARAFYGNPKVVVLDEPNANLDEAGEIALSKSITIAKELNITTILISHRPSILSVVDKVLVVQNGSVVMFCDKDEMSSKVRMLKSGTLHIDKANNLTNLSNDRNPGNAKDGDTNDTKDTKSKKDKD